MKYFMGEKEANCHKVRVPGRFLGSKMADSHFWECIRLEEPKCFLGEGWMLMTALRRDSQTTTPCICFTFYSSQCVVHMLFCLIIKQPYVAGILSLFADVSGQGLAMLKALLQVTELVSREHPRAQAFWLFHFPAHVSRK